MEAMTKAKVAALLSETGHVLELADFDAVAELDALAKTVCGTTRGESRLLFEPFDLCGVLFYPLSVAKSLWYAEKCDDWGLEESQQEALLFWLLTVPNVTGALDVYCERAAADRAVRKLSRRLHCSEAEMSDVYKRCVGIGGSGGAGDIKYGGLVECLLREYGGSPTEWLYETPLPVVESLMNSYAARVNSEIEASNARTPGKAIAPVASERLKSLRAFRLKANEIQDNWSPNDG